MRARGGAPVSAGAVLAQARALHGWRERREAERAAAAAEAFEERAAIMEYQGNMPRPVAERFARECIRRVRGAV